MRAGAILVTGAIATRHGERLAQLLAGRHRIEVLRPDLPLQDLVAAFQSFDLMKSSNKQQPSAELAAFGAAVTAAPNLQWLHSCASGTDRDFLRHAIRRGVTVTSSRGANAMAVAHSAITGLLALARDVPSWVRNQDAAQWKLPARVAVPRDFAGQHAVVLGMGAIGVEVARLCRAFRMRVTGIRRHVQPMPEVDAVRPPAEFADAVADADWLVVACPLTPDTYGLVDARVLARLPAHALMANVSRGEVVVEPDLFAALEAGRLGGVYADVFVEEPLPPASPWWRMPRTLLSPHIAGLSTGFAARTEDVFMANLQKWLAGEPLANVAR